MKYELVLIITFQSAYTHIYITIIANYNTILSLPGTICRKCNAIPKRLEKKVRALPVNISIMYSATNPHPCRTQRTLALMDDIDLFDVPVS